MQKAQKNVHMQLIYKEVNVIYKEPLNGHRRKVKSALFKVQLGEKEEVGNWSQ